MARTTDPNSCKKTAFLSDVEAQAIEVEMAQKGLSFTEWLIDMWKRAKQPKPKRK